MLTDPAYDDLWMIRRTTSRNATGKNADHLLIDDTYKAYIDEQEKAGLLPTGKKATDPVYIYIDFWTDRTLMQKMRRIVYNVFRSFYVSVWFYFLPFLCLVGSYFIPKYLQLVNHSTLPNASQGTSV